MWQTDSNSNFLRAARAGNLESLIAYIEEGTDIDACNSVIIAAHHHHHHHAYLLLGFYLFFRTPSSMVTEWTSTRLCHMFGSEPDLKKDFQTLGILPLKRGAPKLRIRVVCDFATWVRRTAIWSQLSTLALLYVSSFYRRLYILVSFHAGFCWTFCYASYHDRLWANAITWDHSVMLPDFQTAFVPYSLV